jgi:nitroreductase
VDVSLAIASKRDVRRYDRRPIPDDVLTQVLDAGRLSGNARNVQPWEFIVATQQADRERLAQAVYSPGNLTGAAALVAIAIRGGEMQALDAGRAAQNMMLAAWGHGVASCANGIARHDVAAEVLGLAPDQRTALVISFGYPVVTRDPGRRAPEEWSARAKRLPLDAMVRRL